MIKIIDPTMTKVIDVSGTSVTIRPLTPNQRRKAYLAWGELSRVDLTSEVTEEREVDAVQYTVKNVDRDELAVLIAPGVIKIEGHEDKEIIDLLTWMEDDDFWAITFQVLPHTGMDEEEVKNSPSLPEQDSQASPASVTKPAKTEAESVSTTETKES